MNIDVSISPDGIEYPLPREDDYAREYSRVKALVADAVNSDGNPAKFVVGYVDQW
jgi:hypothetical protein